MAEAQQSSRRTSCLLFRGHVRENIPNFTEERRPPLAVEACPPTILQRDLASSENLLEYSSSTSFTSRSTSSLLIFFLLCWNGDWPSIISYSRQPSAHQSGLKVYRSFWTTSGAGGGHRKRK